MTDSFTAAEWTGDGFRLAGVPLAQPETGEVRVRVGACGVCLTEVHLITGFYDELQAPQRLGREFAGIVEAVAPASPTRRPATSSRASTCSADSPK